MTVSFQDSAPVQVKLLQDWVLGPQARLGHCDRLPGNKHSAFEPLTCRGRW